MFSSLSLVISLFFLSNVILFSQSIQWELLKKQQGDLTLAIQAVAAYGEKHCAFAAYEDEGQELRYFQYIQISSDGGGTWRKSRLFPNFRVVNRIPLISSMKFLNEKTIIAVGDSGYIFRTSNAGESWDVIQNKKYWKYNSVDFVDGKYGIAVGAYGIVSITQDSGKTWVNHEKVSIGMFESAQAIKPDYFVVNSAFLCRQFITTNLGETWDSLNTSEDCSQRKTDTAFHGDITRQLFYTDEKNGVFFGKRFPKLTTDYYLHVSLFGVTSDGGKTWDVQDDSTAFSFKIGEEPVFVRAHKQSPFIFAGQWPNGMMFTTDKGKSWQMDSSILSLVNHSDNRDLIFATPNQIYYIGVQWLLKGVIQPTRTEDGPVGNPYLFIESNPVPSHNHLSLKIYGLYSITEDFTVRLYDIMGTMVRDYTLQARQRNNGAWTDVSDTINDLGAGVYIVVFETRSAQCTRRVLVVP